METKNIHLNSNGDMVREKVVYTASGPDDQDAEVLLSDAEKFDKIEYDTLAFDNAIERKDEDNIPY